MSNRFNEQFKADAVGLVMQGRGVSEVSLVEYDQRLDPLAFGSGEATVHQFFTEAGNGGYHDNDLGDVSGNQFFAESVTAIQ